MAKQHQSGPVRALQILAELNGAPLTARSLSERLGLSEQYCSGVLSGIINDGRAWAYRAAGNIRFVFLSAADGGAYGSGRMEAEAAQIIKARNEAANRSIVRDIARNRAVCPVRPSPPANAPVTIATFAMADGMALRDDCKVTSTKAPPGRYEVDPSKGPFGAGFAAVGVGRDVTTGGEWA